MRSGRVRSALSLCLLTALAACGGGAAPGIEARLRGEVESWMKVPYVRNGTTRDGIGGPAFVRAVYQSVFALDIPATVERQIQTGKLVERDALAPGDLVFFQGPGFGPFRASFVGLYVGDDEVALAHQDLGVGIVQLSDNRWSGIFKTARRIPTDPNAAPPTFDAARYGSNRAALLRDIANAWSGTLYREGGTSFEGIGNMEFVREVYEAIHEAELPGTPVAWQTLGERVTREQLEPGDLIIYQPIVLQSARLSRLLNQRHAGIYLGDGDFVHSVRGSAVTISQLDDATWSGAFKTARRADPDALARARSARASSGRAATPPPPASDPATVAPITGPPPPPPATSHTLSAEEQRLRASIEPWRGTPYKIGGTSKDGIDCSAFTRAVFEATYQVQLPRTAEEQEQLGERIDRRSLQTGDLVFFRTQGMGPLFRSRHVGVYLGAGEFAHASGKNGVTISRLDNGYWTRKYATARRLQK